MQQIKEQCLWCEEENCWLYETEYLQKTRNVWSLLFSEAVKPSVIAFDEIVNSNVSKFVELSNKIQGDVKTVVSI